MVDRRVEPSVWLTDGSTDGASGAREPGVTIPGDQAGAADPMLADGPAALDGALPGSAFAPLAEEAIYASDESAYTAAREPAGDDSYRPAWEEVPPPADRIRGPSYQREPPPYPAQVPPGPMPSVAAKVTAPFAALAKARRPTRSSRAVPPAGRPAPPPRPAPRGAAAPTRRAQLVLARIEPWSVMKFSFMISLVGWVVLFVAVAALYYVLEHLGVFHSIQDTITNVTSGKDSGGADANGKWFSASRILGYTMLVGAINVVLITALSTVGAVIYNLVTHLAGGIEVTLKETD
jgi:hypothetical protein